MNLDLADLLAVVRFHLRTIIEKIIPPEEPPKCGQHDCQKKGIIKMVDKALDFHVDVCLDHYRELKHLRDWHLE